ncbi:MAG: hypothetical protein JHC95_19795 [Solirubrobacteraceae bacterium]|nr:hypothetical protein [Solirubrobacteraceae bacterium]
MRKTILAIGVALMTLPLATAVPAAADEPPTAPPGCQDSEQMQLASPDSVQARGEVPWGIDPDCVTLTFVKTPAAESTDKTVSISWTVSIFGNEKGSDWSKWRNVVCTLDGKPVDCTASPETLLADLAPGEHVFTVSGETPSLYGCDGDFCPSAATVTSAPCPSDNDAVADPRYDCVKVYGEVRWTTKSEPVPEVPAKPTETTTPAPVVAAAPAATAKVCTSRRGELTIRLRERKGKAIKSASVFFNGKKIAIAERNKAGRLTATIDFDGLPAGRFSLKIKAKLANGKTATFTRRYFTCEPKRPPSNNLSGANSL